MSGTMADREPLPVPAHRPDVAVIDAPTPPTRPGGLRPWPIEIWLPVLITLVGSLVVVLSGIRGADYPAHLLRAELWHRAGASVWNFYWYGGHPTPGYSVIVPPMADAVGAVPLCVLASVVATVCFCLLARDLLASRTTVWANIAFALAAVVDVVVGRVAFAVGLALALMALLCWHRGGKVVALAFAVLTPLASPVAATFVALAGAAVAVDALTRADGTALRSRLRRAAFPTAMATAALAPVAVTTAVVGADGSFPYRGDYFAVSVLLLTTAALLVTNRVVRIGVVIAVLASVVVFAVPNPLGGNLVRLTQFVAVPVALLGVGTVRRRVRPAAVALLLAATAWSASFGVVAALDGTGDPSTHRDYHQPLIDEVVALNADGRPLGRVEIPFTENHWESYFVAPELPFARGWERQTDLERNKVLYDPDLDGATYHQWLLDNAVRWIALPDVALDEGGRPEGELLERAASLDWLEPVWHDAHWQLFEVRDYTPIVDAPATLVSQDVDQIVITTPRAAVVTIRYEYSDDLSITDGACLVGDQDDGWMTAHLPSAGEYRLQATPGALLPGGDDCPTSAGAGVE